jgi:lipoprotein-anchoring transpeptidase ErfK/SrfK
MADYYPILRKAVDALDRPGRDNRYGVYERARRTIVSRLRGADTPWSDADVDAQVAALDDAARRIEQEFNSETASRMPVGEPAPAAIDPDAPVEPPRQRAAVSAASVPRWLLGGAAAAIVLIGLAATYVAYRDSGRPRSASPPAEAVASSAKGAQPVSAANDGAHASYVLRKQLVYYRTTHPAGTIVISLNQKVLHVVQANRVAIRYAIGVGPECAKLAGLFQVTDKVKQGGSNEVPPADAAPTPRRVASVTARYGPMALFFGERHAVHGTSEPTRIGLRASYGCLHQWNHDISDLYERVALNDRIVVAN